MALNLVRSKLKMILEAVMELVNCGKVELEEDWERFELELKKGLKPVFFSADFRSPFRSCLDRNA